MESIEAKLRKAWRQERRFYHVRGISRFLLWAVAMVVMDLLVDWGIIFKARLPENMRYILPAINVAVLGWVAWHEWFRFLRKYNPVIAALEVERQHPELASLLVSYTQLKGTPVNQPDVSPELLDAMRGQAVVVTRPMDFREIVEFRQLKNLMIVFVVVMLLFAGLSVARSGHMKSLFLRMTGHSTKYPTNTRIEEVSGHRVVQQGSAPVIAAKVGGRVPDSGSIYVRPAKAGSWQALPLTRLANAGDSRFQRQLPEVTANLEYFLKIGDDRTDVFTVKVVPPPEIVSAKVTYTYPAYLNRPAASETVTELNLEAPEGTEIRWQVKVNTAVKAMEVSIEDAVLPAAISPDGLTAEFSVTVTNNFRYGFRWTEKSQGFQYPSVKNTVRLVPDSPPVVEILVPDDYGLATLNKRLRIVADASDDYGLAKAWLVYSIDGHNEERLALPDPGGTKRRLDYDLALKDKIPGLAEGAKLEFHIEVGDSYPRGAHVSQTATRHLTMVDEEQYLQWFRRELDAQRDEIQKARDAEETASAKVRELKKQESK